MKFRYDGEAHLEKFLGQDWDHGSVHEYTDAYSIQKLTNNPNFHAVGTPAKAPVVTASAQVLEDLQPPVEVPQMPRRTRGPNKPKTVSE